MIQTIQEYFSEIKKPKAGDVFVNPTSLKKTYFFISTSGCNEGLLCSFTEGSNYDVNRSNDDTFSISEFNPDLKKRLENVIFVNENKQMYILAQISYNTSNFINITDSNFCNRLFKNPLATSAFTGLSYNDILNWYKKRSMSVNLEKWKVITNYSEILLKEYENAIE